MDGGGISITGGLTINSGTGLVVTDKGLTVSTGGLKIGGSGATITGGLTINDSGMKIVGNLIVTGGVTLYTGGVGSNVWASTGATSVGAITSDRRLKDKISQIQNSLSKITSLRGVYFSWIHDEASGIIPPDNRRHIGLLAQDVQDIFPEAVDEIHDGKYLGVRYQYLVPVLIEAIREMDAKIANFEKIENLKQITRIKEETNDEENIFDIIQNLLQRQRDLENKFIQLKENCSCVEKLSV